MPLRHLLSNNKRWANETSELDPQMFATLAQQQSPKYLWIGCSDSRVPANEIVGLLPGELFVHRNVANLVKHTDMNCQAVIQYAVDVLGVEHIIVCGHYGCGGIAAALGQTNAGVADYWLRSVKDSYLRTDKDFRQLDRETRVDIMCENNVIDQTANVAHSKIVQRAWQQGKPLMVHGWIYSIRDGILKDLNCRYSSLEQIDPIYQIELEK
ncbi:carbonate dehydratase [Porticoccaceae bacterium]|nr:carbonate dehydratase [Porticoccaceae bacterium]